MDQMVFCVGGSFIKLMGQILPNRNPIVCQILKTGGAVCSKSLQNWWGSYPTLPTGSANPECRHKKACEMHFVVIHRMKVLKSKSSYDFS